MTVLVAGGGITGLAAAWELARHGVPVTLVDPSPALGGKIATEAIDGFLVEHGPDSFLAARPAAVDLAIELGLRDELVGVLEPRMVYVRHRERMVPMPEGMGLVLPGRVRPFALSPLFSIPEKARMALDLVMPRSAPGPDLAVGPFLRRRLGDAPVERLAGPLVGGIYGTPIDELSLDAVIPQLRAAEREHRSLLLAGLAQARAARLAAAGAAAGDDQPARPRVGMFATLAGGVGRLVDALVADLAARRQVVSLRTGTHVDRLSLAGGRPAVRLSDGDLLIPEAIVLATPAPVAAALLEPLEPAAARAVGSIPHGSSSVVSLGYRRDALAGQLRGHGVLVPPGDGMAISACTWSSLKWPGRAPDGALLLRAFVPDPAPIPESDLVAAVRRDVERLHRISTPPELVRVSRFEGSMPRYTVGHVERVAAIRAALARHPAIEVAGAAYTGVGIPECISQGRAAAARIAHLLDGGNGIDRRDVRAASPVGARH